jgi:hypothetical protein
MDDDNSTIDHVMNGERVQEIARRLVDLKEHLTQLENEIDTVLCTHHIEIAAPQGPVRATIISDDPFPHVSFLDGKSTVGLQLIVRDDGLSMLLMLGRRSRKVEIAVRSEFGDYSPYLLAECSNKGPAVLLGVEAGSGSIGALARERNRVANFSLSADCCGDPALTLYGRRGIRRAFTGQRKTTL